MATTPTAVTVELSPEAREKVNWFMQRTLQSLSTQAGEKVKLICGNSITEHVLQELRDATLSWTFNTEPLTMDPSRMFYYKENLDITDLVPRDSGVYACVVSWGADDTVKENLTLGVFSLEVETESPSRYVFEHEPAKMDCHSLTLGELFPDAVRYWLFNGTHTSALPVTKASNKTYDVIQSVNRSMTGVWECQVLQQKTERVWATAWHLPGEFRVYDHLPGEFRGFRHLPGEVRELRHLPGEVRELRHLPGEVRELGHLPGELRGLEHLPGEFRVFGQSAWYNVSVQDPPSNIDRTFRFFQENWYTVVIISSVILILFVLLFCYSAYRLKNIQDEVDEKFQDERKLWEETIFKHGWNGVIEVDKMIPRSAPNAGKDGLPQDGQGEGGEGGGGGGMDEDNKRRSQTEFSLGDGGDSVNKATQTDSEMESENGEEGDNRNDVTTNAIYSHLRRNWNPGRNDYEVKRYVHGERWDSAKSGVGFLGDGNENKQLSTKRYGSKKAVKFGKNILSQHKDANLAPATREDMFAWLHKNSSLTRVKGWSLNLKTYLVPQTGERVTTLNINRNSAASEEEGLRCSTAKRNERSKVMAKSHALRSHDERQMTSSENFDLTLSPKYEADQRHTGSRGPFTDIKKFWEKEQNVVREKTYKAGEHEAGTSRNFMQFRDGQDGDLHVGDVGHVGLTPKSIASFSRKGGRKSLPGKSKAANNSQKSGEMPWRRWLDSKLPRRAGYPARSNIPWLRPNSGVVYTALPQTEEYFK
ncbi:hypothetical protein EGW08_015789 [Elysia chlorotica]|uniref:Ig-like domain-containing protein n=1 Tax=Elysia chlorotica TaxID=188477 RepID=A0A433T4H2_ELYCH|nr:hypothetical protein EGW08_015789 [Elysia chlorotica]